ncbi:ankyrin repeat domain containing protein 6 diego [Haematobia irritans]|uniref:ankyrin repeat domain containing protein 6 diego n=1 Tax=Haematobia irritans TaxID=7368 RepID=UPI003F50707A
MNGSLPNHVSKPTSTEWTICHEAAARGDDFCLYKILKNNGQISFQRNSVEGNTPLHEAARRGYSRCVTILCKSLCLIEIKSNINIKNNYGFSALHLAAQNGHNQCCRELILRGSNLNTLNKYGDSPLHTACRYGHVAVARILISAFCDKNVQNNNGDTALHITCAMGRRKLTTILLKCNCKTGIRNLQGDTPLDIVKRKCFVELEIMILSMKKHYGIRCNSFFKDNIFSPYGCNSIFDARYIPLSNVELLSKSKLRDGEQFFFDLAGNIQKGKKCVNDRCYCNPITNHI